MHRFSASAIVGILTLAMASPAWAGHSHASSQKSSVYRGSNFVNYQSNFSYKTSGTYSKTFVTNYKTQYGKTFSHGIFYPGLNHHQWTSRYWYGRYGCYCYWCPSACCWYYWCAPQYCYYPISYITIAPPGATDAPAVAAAPAGPVPPAGPPTP